MTREHTSSAGHAAGRTASRQIAHAFPGWARALLNDPRDTPFVGLMLQCAGMAALGVAMFFLPTRSWWLAGGYWLLLAATVLDRFILMLHCTSHRKLFKPNHARLNAIIPWLLGPFCGETPESYFVHHLGMHHREENLESDLSSTMKYQRDKFWHWLRYFLRFLLLGLPELAIYQYRKKNFKLLRRLIIGETSFLLVMAVLASFNWWATLVVFVVPVLVVRALMMIGNWGQHAFVCQEEPENPYRNSITCINTRYNRRCFNDGYHIHHHVKARCHFSELPAEFEDNKATYGENDAIVFDGLDFFGVWLLLMVGAYGTLARRVVQLPGAPVRDEKAMLELLKSRLQPF